MCLLAQNDKIKSVINVSAIGDFVKVVLFSTSK